MKLTVWKEENLVNPSGMLWKMVSSNVDCSV